MDMRYTANMQSDGEWWWLNRPNVLQHDEQDINPNNCTIPWISEYFGECILTDLHLASFCIGIISIIFWMSSQFPQVITNFNRQDASALSGIFLLVWILGDVLNLMGTLFTQQYGIQLYSIVFYIMLDIVLASQFMYYLGKRKIKEAKLKNLERQDQAVIEVQRAANASSRKSPKLRGYSTGDNNARSKHHRHHHHHHHQNRHQKRVSGKFSVSTAIISPDVPLAAHVTSHGMGGDHSAKKSTEGYSAFNTSKSINQGEQEGNDNETSVHIVEVSPSLGTTHPMGSEGVRRDDRDGRNDSLHSDYSGWSDTESEYSAYDTQDDESTPIIVNSSSSSASFFNQNRQHQSNQHQKQHQQPQPPPQQLSPHIDRQRLHTGSTTSRRGIISNLNSKVMSITGTDSFTKKKLGSFALGKSTKAMPSIAGHSITTGTGETLSNTGILGSRMQEAKYLTEGSFSNAITPPYSSTQIMDIEHLSHGSDANHSNIALNLGDQDMTLEKGTKVNTFLSSSSSSSSPYQFIVLPLVAIFFLASLISTPLIQHRYHNSLNAGDVSVIHHTSMNRKLLSLQSVQQHQNELPNIYHHDDTDPVQFIDIQFWNNPVNIIGYTLACICAIFYIFSRIPQIIKNRRRQSVAGLSALMFIFAICGNLTYGLSVFLRSYNENFVLERLPWLVGSVGTLVFDAYIVLQCWMYYKADNVIVYSAEENMPIFPSISEHQGDQFNNEFYYSSDVVAHVQHQETPK